jgi:plasmid stabilization system protein ParE
VTLDFAYNPLAEEEYGAVTEQYAAGQRDVQRRFIETFEAAILQIRQFPESGPVARGVIRSNVLSGFPYTIVADGAFFPKCSLIETWRFGVPELDACNEVVNLALRWHG